MYQVSDACKQALRSPVQTHALKGTCDNRSFIGDLHVIKDSFRLNKQMCDSTEVRIGGVYIGQLQMTFSSRFANTRGSWMGKVITPQIGIKVGADFEWIPVPSGQYIIREAVWTSEGLEVTAYDNMSKFDKSIGLSSSSGTAYDFLNAACQACSVTLGMTREQLATFVNGDRVLGMYPTDSVVTWRDMIGWLAQALCAFATINRNGALIFVKFPSKNNSFTEINMNQRYTGASFSDFDSFFTQISVTDIEENVAYKYIIGTNNGLALNLGANPFLQYGTKDTKDLMRLAILDSLKDFYFAPFSASTLLNPTWDLGDCIKFTGGIGKGCIGTVMAITLTLDTVSLDGFGDNPALQDVRSATDKEISGMGGTSQGQKTVYFTYSNVSELNIGTQSETIAETQFVTTAATTVTLWAEVDADVKLSDPTATITFSYFLDNDELPYHPVHTVGEDGKHLIGLNYYLLNLSADEIHRFEIAMRVNGGTAKIPMNNVHFLLSGQGLVQESGWDGTIDRTDYFSQPIVGKLSVPFTDQTPEVIFDTPKQAEVSDLFGISTRGRMRIGFREEADVKMFEPEYAIVTSDGDYLVTSDGDYMKT